MYGLFDFQYVSEFICSGLFFNSSQHIHLYILKRIILPPPTPPISLGKQGNERLILAVAN